VFGGVPQSQPVAGTAATAAPQAPLPHPGPPATQLAVRIAPLFLDADGVHRLTVHLHPADLGPVQVVAEIRNGEISVQLSGATDAGNDALRNALDDLRRELDKAGFSSTTLDLRQGGAGQQDQAARQQSGLPANGRTSTIPDASDPVPVTPQPVGPDPDGRLDIKV
jgi:flagellar hook-length control protein FliK